MQVGFGRHAKLPPTSEIAGSEDEAKNLTAGGNNSSKFKELTG